MLFHSLPWQPLSKWMNTFPTWKDIILSPIKFVLQHTAKAEWIINFFFSYAFANRIWFSLHKTLMRNTWLWLCSYCFLTSSSASCLPSHPYNFCSSCVFLSYLGSIYIQYYISFLYHRIEWWLCTDESEAYKKRKKNMEEIMPARSTLFDANGELMLIGLLEYVVWMWAELNESHLSSRWGLLKLAKCPYWRLWNMMMSDCLSNWNLIFSAVHSPTGSIQNQMASYS